MAQPEYIFSLLKQDGEKALDEFIAQRESEALSLDFKRAATGAGSARLENSDRENLARAISGFGNTAGGVIVWGIDCRPNQERGDVAHTKHPIANVRRFVSLIEGAVAGATLPSHSGVESHVVFEKPDGTGFAATLIPQADNYPLQVPNVFRYFMRAGSSFEPIPHSILATMFGRRPTPLLRINAAVSGKASFKNGILEGGIQLTVTNAGAGIARDVYLSIGYPSTPEATEDLRFNWMSDPFFEHPTNGPRSLSAISHGGRRLPPGAHAITYNISLRLNGRVIRPLEIHVTCGCGNGPPTQRVFSQTANRLLHCYRLGAELDSNPSINTDWLSSRLFGLVED
jgi:hypothetical protein